MTSQPTTQVLTSTTFDLPGHVVARNLGLCWGVIVRSVGITKSLTGGLRSIRQGEVPEFTEVVNSARRAAFDRLVAHTEELGGNAALGVRFDSSDIGSGLAEIVAYGTAVVVRPA
jgi:uncharacterized protein YbjQ (UPF0145 family)